MGQELEIFGISPKFYRRGTEAENHRHRHKKKHLHKYGYGEADAHPIEWAHFEPPDSFLQKRSNEHRRLRLGKDEASQA